jgi:hypothetical protein
VTSATHLPRNGPEPKLIASQGSPIFVPSHSLSGVSGTHVKDPSCEKKDTVLVSWEVFSGHYVQGFSIPLSLDIRRGEGCSVHSAPAALSSQSLFKGFSSRMDKETGLLMAKLAQASTAKRVCLVGMLKGESVL